MWVCSNTGFPAPPEALAEQAPKMGRNHFTLNFIKLYTQQCVQLGGNILHTTAAQRDEVVVVMLTCAVCWYVVPLTLLRLFFTKISLPESVLARNVLGVHFTAECKLLTRLCTRQRLLSTFLWCRCSVLCARHRTGNAAHKLNHTLPSERTGGQ